MESESGMPNLKVLIGLAGALALGILCNILACVIWGNWLPIFVIIAYFLAPLPNLMCSRCGTDPLDVSGRNFKDLGFFLTGALVISGFGLPAVLAHAQLIQIPALLLGIGGGIIVYASIIVYIHFFHTKPKDSF